MRGEPAVTKRLRRSNEAISDNTVMLTARAGVGGCRMDTIYITGSSDVEMNYLWAGSTNNNYGVATVAYLGSSDISLGYSLYRIVQISYD